MPSNKIIGKDSRSLFLGDLVMNEDNGKRFVIGGRFIAIFDFFTTGKDIVVPHIKLLAEGKSNQVQSSQTVVC